MASASLPPEGLSEPAAVAPNGLEWICAVGQPWPRGQAELQLQMGAAFPGSEPFPAFLQAPGRQCLPAPRKQISCKPVELRVCVVSAVSTS